MSLSQRYLDLALNQLAVERSTAAQLASLRKAELIMHLLHDETIVQAFNLAKKQKGKELTQTEKEEVLQDFKSRINFSKTHKQTINKHVTKHLKKSMIEDAKAE